MFHTTKYIRVKEKIKTFVKQTKRTKTKTATLDNLYNENKV